MTLGRLLLQSLLVTGRVSVILSYALMGLAVLFRVPKIEGRAAAPAALEEPRSLPGLVATLLLCVLTPLCVWRGWGSLADVLPVWVAAPLVALGSVVCLGMLSWLAWAGLVLGRAAHFLARVDRGARLVEQGPFALVRHPVYFGLGMMFAATALAGLSWIVAGIAVLWWPLAAWRASLEDALLRRAFGAEFERYAEHVPRLWPWRRASP